MTAPIRLGTLREIIANQKMGCNFCKLLECSIKNKEGVIDRGLFTLLDLESAVCTLCWEVDGREMFENQDNRGGSKEKREFPRGLTRRIHVRWSHTQLKDSYLVFVASKGPITASDAEGVWAPDLLFLGREISYRGITQTRVKSWIDLCRTKHQGPCFTPPWGKKLQAFHAMTTHSYFGVIDVFNMQLTQLPQPTSISGSHRSPSDSSPTYKIPEYVALSYVWGGIQSYRTLRSNVSAHLIHGGLEKVFHKLPKVIRDTIDLVRRLGFQYLWVDSLCIIQDSAKSWQLNAYNMDLIYGNAVFTVCAADGSNASTGLEAMDETMRVQRRDQYIYHCTEDVRLMVTRPPEMYIKSSKWNTRAWTFQERLLSQRCLIFTGSRVYFQCRSTEMSEDIYADREGAGWSLDHVDALLQTFRQLPLRSFWAYMMLLKFYTARELTKDKDIVAAFSGVSNVMRETMHAPFIFGLPTSHFDLALLWSYPLPVKRRQGADNESQMDAIEFPSWSWSGWVGPPVEYRRDMLQGCLDNVNEWLKARTWIRWYIRDGNGDIRPLWDPKEWEVDSSEQEKWQGYGKDRSSGSMLFQGKQKPNPGNSHQHSSMSKYVDQRIPILSVPQPPRYAVSPPGYGHYTPSNPTSPTTRRFGVSAHSSSPSKLESSSDWRSDEPMRPISYTNDVASMHKPVKQTKYANSQRKSIYTEAFKHEPMSQSMSLLHPTAHNPRESQQNQAMPASSTEFSIWILSTVVNCVYHNEFGRFLVDILSATIRLVKFLLGFHVVHSGMPLDLHQEFVTESDVQTTTSQSGVANSPSFQDHQSRHANSWRTPLTKNNSQDRKEQNYEDCDGVRSVRFVDKQGIRTQHLETIIPSVEVESERQHFLPNTRHHRQDSQFLASHSHQRQSMATEQRLFYDLAFQPDKKIEPEDTESEPSFQITLKEYPYRPVISPYIDDHSDPRQPMLPILQFWTWHTFLYVQCPSQNLDATAGLIRCNIADTSSDWCGSILLDGQCIGKMKTAKQEFIALSKAKKFTYDECKTWSYYVPKEREESEWDLLYVLLIVWNDGKWERVGLGKVFREAFKDATWKEIVLA